MTGSTMAERRREESTRFGRLPATVSLEIREPGSALTHFAALILVAVGAGPLMLHARRYGSAWTAAGVCVFLLTAGLLYAASTTYHTVVSGRRTTTILRKIDHSSISVMIAGSYTPLCLTLALAGVILKLFWITCPKWVSSVLYLGMGWLCVFAMKPLLAGMPSGAFAWLLAGGIAYSVGAAIYAMHPKAFDARHIYFGSHEIFHVFIMIGTLCHYIMLDRYITRIG